MFWRPRKTIRLGGVRVNIGKRGMSASAGHGLATFSTGQVRWSGNRGRTSYADETPATASFGRRLLSSPLIVLALFVGIGGNHWGWAAGIVLFALVMRAAPAQTTPATAVASSTRMGFVGAVRLMMSLTLVAIAFTFAGIAWSMNDAISGDAGVMAYALSFVVLLLALWIRPKAQRRMISEAEEMPEWIRESVPEDTPAWIQQQTSRNAPTPRQLAYARSLGIVGPEQFSRRALSELISGRESRSMAATRDSLREIDTLGGILPKSVLTEFEAQNALDYLNALDLCCPKCDVPVSVDDRTCLSCRAKLKWEIRIPLAALSDS